MPLILVASPQYLAQRGTPRTLDELAAHDCINVALANGRRAHWAFLPRHGQRRDRVPIMVTPKGPLIVMDELDAVVNAAEAGLGITMSSAENVLTSLRAGRLVRVLEDYEAGGQDAMHTQVIMQYPRKRQLPIKVRALVDFLLKELKGHDPLELVGGCADVRSSL
jgi:DNA-binding transcriptional LysR family regulator